MKPHPSFWLANRFAFVFGAIAPALMCQFSPPAVAQSIRADSTLSTNVNTSDHQNFTINGGEQVGDNLFHSFDKFSVPTGGSAVFANSADIANIISRVTGSSVSDIDGLIQSNGTADLFLLNPNGIIFGPDAQLDIGGSFIGSTAESLHFADATVFVASDTTPAPLLTLSTPVGLQLGQTSGDIQVIGSGYTLTRLSNFATVVMSSSNLQVDPGNTLALIASNLSLEGGRVSTNTGRIALGSVETGRVQFNPDDQGWAFDYSEVTDFGDMQFSQALVDAVGPGGGLIQLQGRNISLQNGSRVLIQNQGPQISGGIFVNAAESVEASGLNPTGTIGSGLVAESLLGESGDIVISTQRLTFSGGSGVESRALLAPGGNVVINASESVLVEPSPSEPRDTNNIDTSTLGSAKAGDITLNTGTLIIRGGSSVSSITFGAGNSGDVIINAQAIEVAGVENNSLIASLISAGTLDEGNAGNLHINTGSLVVKEGGRVDSSTAAGGDAGSVTINASEFVTVSGTVPGSINPSLIISSANLLDESLRISLGLPPFPTGNAGDLTINTPELHVAEGAQVTVRNDGTGIGGTLRVGADVISLEDEAGLTASTQSGGGGDISLQAREFLLARRGSIISAEAGGAGDGGNITIETPFLIALENSDIIANAFQGQGGNIEITAQSILGTEFRDQLTSESDITASSEFGVSGTVEINNLSVDPGSTLVALPETVTDPSQQITATCSEAQSSQFIATGRGGLPPNPIGQVGSDRTWNDLRDLSAFLSSDPDIFVIEPRVLTPSAANTLTEVNGWHRNAAGQVELVSIAPTALSSAEQVTCLASDASKAI